jgi:hypothetical protein
MARYPWGEEMKPTTKTLELLAPGYTRTMKAVSTDDAEWVITDHIDAALGEVTVVESATSTPFGGSKYPPRLRHY